MVFFDQIAFQSQRFQLRSGHDILKSPDMAHHLIYLRSFARALKILTDAIAQLNCLTDIDHMILLIMHQIDTGTCRQLFQFFLYIKGFFVHEIKSR